MARGGIPAKFQFVEQLKAHFHTPFGVLCDSTKASLV